MENLKEKPIDRVILPCETESWNNIAEVLKRKITNVEELSVRWLCVCSYVQQAIRDITGEKDMRIGFFKNYYEGNKNETSNAEETGLISKASKTNNVLI